MADLNLFSGGASLYRTTEGLGRWPARGQVAAVGIGHSPTLRRWDGDPETSVGGWAVLAIRKAIADAGVDPAKVDGLVMVNGTSTGGGWPADQPIPEDFLARFERTDDPLDGLTKLSPAWILKNIPELTGIKFLMLAPSCITMALTAAIEAVGQGLATTCLAMKGWHNLAGRYTAGGPNAIATVSGQRKWETALAGPGCYGTAMQFQRYLHLYGKTKEMMAPFVVNSRANGLLMPEGYWAQHSPKPLTKAEYNAAPWVAEPANLLDNDLPIQSCAAYLVTTAERARDMAQKPAYVLGHAGAGSVNNGVYLPVAPRSTVLNLEEVEELCASTGRKLEEASGVAGAEFRFENMYDGFSLFHVFHIEGLGFAGLKRGEALDFFQDDIGLTSPHPVSPSGGNIGGGRTRFWMHTDSIQQIQGRAGARQISVPADVGISGGHLPNWTNFIVWSAEPS